MNWKRYMSAVSTALIAGFLTAPAAEKSDRAEVLFESARQRETLEGNLAAAIQQYNEIVSSYGSNRAVAAKALVQIGRCYEKLGSTEARKAYERAVREYGDQREAAEEARNRLVALRDPSVLPDGSGMLVRRLWADAMDIEGAPSLDGRYLSYVDWETGDLAVRDLLKGEKRRLTNKGSWDDSEEFALFSSFSTDGKQVAYAWWKDNLFDLRIVSLGEPKPRVLYRDEETEYLQPAAWSPDGKNILVLFSKKDKTNQIVLVSVADGSTRVLKTLDWRVPEKMSLSPDGRYIAFDFPPKEDSPDRDISVLATDGSRETTLVEHPGTDLVPVWTPDGKKILFTSDRSGTMGLWAVPLADGKAQGPAELIKPDIGQIFPMGMSREGSYFYGVGTGTSDVYVGTLDLTTGKMQASPSKATQRFVGSNSWPDWSPDGRYLAYLSERGPVWSPRKIICIRSVESGEERELRPNFKYFNRPRWSPDSRSVLTNGTDAKGRKGVFQIDVQSSQVTPIIQAEPGAFLGGPVNPPAWSPDGKAIFYVESITNTTRLVRRDVESRQEKEIVRIEGSISGIRNWEISPDGRLIAFNAFGPAKKSMVLKIVPTDGGESRELSKPKEFSLLGWTPDSRELLFAKVQDHKTEVWRMPVTGGEPRKLDVAFENLRNLRFHPDGQRIAFSAGGGKTDVWVMENFLSGLTAGK